MLSKREMEETFRPFDIYSLLLPPLKVLQGFVDVSGLKKQKNRTGPTFLNTLCRLYLKGDKDEKGDKMLDR